MALAAAGTAMGTPDDEITILVRAESAEGERVAAALRGFRIAPVINGERDLAELGAGVDAVVLHCDRFDANSTEEIRRVVAEAHDTRVVAIVPDALGRHAVRKVVTAGAAGVVFDASIEDSLGPTLHAVLAGQVTVPSQATNELLPPVLSRREKEALRLAVAGHTNDEIAAALFLATSTVKSHLASAFGKLGVHSRNEAAAMLLDPDEPLGQVVLGG